MVNIYIVLKSLKKQGKKTWLIISQLTIAFVAIVISIGVMLNIENTINEVKKIVDFNSVRIEAKENLKDITDKDIEIFYNKLKTNNGIKEIGFYEMTKFGTGDEEEENKIFVDKGMLRIINLKISSGRLLKDEDFSKKSNGKISVLVGSEIGKKHPLNSIYKDTVYDPKEKKVVEVNYQVIGILDENSRFWTNEKFIVHRIPNAVIIPKEITHNITNITNSMLLKLDNSEDLSSVNTFIIKEFTKGKTIVEAKNFNMLMMEKFKEKKIEIFYLITFSVILIILSCFGLIGVTLSSITKRKREFGIRYTLGASPNSLVKIVYGEILTMFLIANIYGLIISLILAKFIPNDIGISITINTIIYSFAVCIILSLFTGVIPIIKIINTKPIELIRGNK